VIIAPFDMSSCRQQTAGLIRVFVHGLSLCSTGPAPSQHENLRPQGSCARPKQACPVRGHIFREGGLVDGGLGSVATTRSVWLKLKTGRISSASIFIRFLRAGRTFPTAPPTRWRNPSPARSGLGGSHGRCARQQRELLCHGPDRRVRGESAPANPMFLSPSLFFSSVSADEESGSARTSA
jgi:hypothetical protein